MQFVSITSTVYTMSCTCLFFCAHHVRAYSAELTHETRIILVYRNHLHAMWELPKQQKKVSAPSRKHSTPRGAALLGERKTTRTAVFTGMSIYVPYQKRKREVARGW